MLAMMSSLESGFSLRLDGWALESGFSPRLDGWALKSGFSLRLDGWNARRRRVGKNPGFFKKTQPSGFFWVFLGFFGFFGFFWVFLGFFARTRGILGFISVSRILLGASRLYIIITLTSFS
jgi:hypothetical protein